MLVSKIKASDSGASLRYHLCIYAARLPSAPAIPAAPYLSLTIFYLTTVELHFCLAADALLRCTPQRGRLPGPARLPPGAVAAASGLGGGAAAAPLRFPALPRRDAQLHRPEVRHAGRLGAAAVRHGVFITPSLPEKDCDSNLSICVGRVVLDYLIAILILALP